MERLAEILADMVRSALAWEKKNGVPPKPPKTKEVLTVYTRAYTLASHEPNPGGKQSDGNDHTDSESHKDV